MNRKIYMDYAATSPLREDIIAALPELANRYHNASSVGELSAQNRRDIEAVRRMIARVINADPEEIIFTSGSSESNSLAIDGFLNANKNNYYRVIASNIEHKSILNNPNVTGHIKCNNSGQLLPNQFEGYSNTLFCVMHANNEIGTINPIKEIAEVVHKHNNYLLVDATQSFTKVPIDVKDMGIDMLSASGHKIGSLKNVGFLYVSKNVKVSPIIYGTQEMSRRGGTYNHMGIVSFGMAIDCSLREDKEYIADLRNRLMVKLLDVDENIIINGCLSGRLQNNLNICVRNINIDAQQLIGMLDEAGFIVSAGSACSSGNPEPSYVLKAIGLSDEDCLHSIRITLGVENTEEEIDSFVECLKSIIDMYRD